MARRPSWKIITCENPVEGQGLTSNKEVESKVRIQLGSGGGQYSGLQRSQSSDQETQDPRSPPPALQNYVFHPVEDSSALKNLSPVPSLVNQPGREDVSPASQTGERGMISQRDRENSENMGIVTELRNNGGSGPVSHIPPQSSQTTSLLTQSAPSPSPQRLPPTPRQPARPLLPASRGLGSPDSSVCSTRCPTRQTGSDYEERRTDIDAGMQRCSWGCSIIKFKFFLIDCILQTIKLSPKNPYCTPCIDMSLDQSDSTVYPETDCEEEYRVLGVVRGEQCELESDTEWEDCTELNTVPPQPRPPLEMESDQAWEDCNEDWGDTRDSSVETVIQPPQ